MANFLEFLITSARLTREDCTPSSTLEHTIRGDEDRLQAWREHAPSRRCITGPTGPLTPDRIRTRGGIFSLLVFRGVTFGAPVAHEFPGYLETLDAWHRLYTTERDPSYYCNPRVYGNQVGRGVDVVPRLWEASEVLLGLLLAEVQPSFRTVWRHLADARGMDKAMLYPNIGDLIGYLICVDLVYAGILLAPSLDDMGDIVADMGKGARDGLERLGLVRKPANKSAVSHAFVDLVQYLYAHAPPDFASLRFDMFIVEHGLCKYKRLVK